MPKFRCYFCHAKEKPTHAILQSSTLLYTCANCGQQNKAHVVSSEALLDLIANSFVALGIHDCEYLPEGPQLTKHDYLAFITMLRQTDNIVIHAVT